VEAARQTWEKALWHLSKRRFACAPNAEAALAQQRNKLPPWLTVDSQLSAHRKQARPGRPCTSTPPDRTDWQVIATVAVEDAALTRALQRQASFLVATNVHDTSQLPDQELIQTDQQQHSVERGFSFLKDPLFLASSIYVKKPSRIVALSLVMALCLLVYRLAEHRLRDQFAATSQTVPNQLKQPTDRPTRRWMFQCFEDISLVGVTLPNGPPHRDIAGLEPLHEHVVALLGMSCEQCYTVDE
jgi:transposase